MVRSAPQSPFQPSLWLGRNHFERDDQDLRIGLLVSGRTTREPIVKLLKSILSGSHEPIFSFHAGCEIDNHLPELSPPLPDLIAVAVKECSAIVGRDLQPRGEFSLNNLPAERGTFEHI